MVGSAVGEPGMRVCGKGVRDGIEAKVVLVGEASVFVLITGWHAVRKAKVINKIFFKELLSYPPVQMIY
jgi:hypothetical protein